MSLKHLKDSELLTQTKRLVENERHMVTQILRNLREVERRKLFSDLGYGSLFQYAVSELKYSEGQAGRRIQAMRLIREIPELEDKIKTGKLSLSNVAQAQSYFREATKTPAGLLKTDAPSKPMDRTEKLNVLTSLENKSTREGQKVLLSKLPQLPLPKERERIVTGSHTEVSFVISSELKRQLEQVRALLGSKGAAMNLAQLVSAMAELSVETLSAKKFGKKRSQMPVQQPRPAEQSGNVFELFQELSVSKGKQFLSAPTRQKAVANQVGNQQKKNQQSVVHRTPAQELSSSTAGRHVPDASHPSHHLRYIPRSVKHAVWTRDLGSCVKCGNQPYECVILSATKDPVMTRRDPSLSLRMTKLQGCFGRYLNDREHPAPVLSLQPKTGD